MNTLRIQTNGLPIEQTYSMLHFHPELKTEMSNMDLRIGDMEIRVSFDSHDEMIDFCKEHNFTYVDKRTA